MRKRGEKGVGSDGTLLVIIIFVIMCLGLMLLLDGGLIINKLKEVLGENVSNIIGFVSLGLFILFIIILLAKLTKKNKAKKG